MMSWGLLRTVGHALARRRLATPPAVWGKLPTHGDFVHHRATLEERQAWMTWVEQVWSKCPELVHDKPPERTRSGERWVALDVAPSGRRLFQIPIAFVLPPGYMPFAARQYVQGVVIPSRDKVGRSCPFVLYQRVLPHWMQRQWQRSPQADGQTMLFWWARMAWQVAHTERSLVAWLQRLDVLWGQYEPGFAQWLGAAAREPERSQVQGIVGGVCGDDPAHNLRGVYHLPWTDWPSRVLRHERPDAAFWTQDGQGRYVQAGSSLQQLWSSS